MHGVCDGRSEPLMIECAMDATCPATAYHAQRSLMRWPAAWTCDHWPVEMPSRTKTSCLTFARGHLPLRGLPMSVTKPIQHLHQTTLDSSCRVVLYSCWAILVTRSASSSGHWSPSSEVLGALASFLHASPWEGALPRCAGAVFVRGVPPHSLHRLFCRP